MPKRAYRPGSRRASVRRSESEASACDQSARLRRDGWAGKGTCLIALPFAREFDRDDLVRGDVAGHHEPGMAALAVMPMLPVDGGGVGGGRHGSYPRLFCT